jgi:hypothetical protein
MEQLGFSGGIEKKVKRVVIIVLETGLPVGADSVGICNHKEMS